MRYALDHKAQTHQRIVKEASARFRRDGIGATGLQPLMKALGLTHGGFYAHFKSKDDLVEQALRHAVDEMKAITTEVFDHRDEQESLNYFIELYLSAKHKEEAETGCPLPSICLELGQRNQPSPMTDEIVDHLLTLFENSLPCDDTNTKSILVLSSLVGALMLSRSTHDQQLSERILKTTRELLQREVLGDQPAKNIAVELLTLQ
ncbi:TetR/AcrR family transcriptional regulator [Pseudomonas sp. CDFA 602]|uniref:TetR/AcrR family transcriptional regulator n=1 Tax=Pseudomonas californiensis TaxID=2829823 RepID=UPI001E3B369A|nr:TetR/AcrR family transcriptional regulator [Pseudomonas californiensis]MCD5997076.1 TetR/AcrR family transcriptional regulator [Pseudomonas californiensis]MCD6002678.1 TetR/AcrR family transcriptional regulator [Pseudomonas californiensis]